MLAAELLKLVSMRSTRWCGSLVLVVSIGTAAIWADRYRAAPGSGGSRLASDMPASVVATQVGCIPGIVLVMVIAVLSVTAEYRTGTIALTFHAAPVRSKVVLAKTTAVGLCALMLGESAAWLAYGTAKLINPGGVGSIATGADLRLVAGTGVIYLVAAVAAVAIGVLIRSGIGALALLLVYVVLIENVIAPAAGSGVQAWMPFTMATQFLLGGSTEFLGWFSWLENAAALPPWWALVYLTLIAVGLTATAAVVITRRDA